MAINEDELTQYYSSLESIHKRALDDLRWHLDRCLSDPAQDDISRIYNSSKISARVKAIESVLRKCRRDGIQTPQDIPDKIEDLLGVRVATPNKSQASRLFEHLQMMKAEWFCEVTSGPRFVPYTFVDNNKYSARTGYQAYHVTFLFKRSYKPTTDIDRWPVEIQIMSQLWEFWANYSREYFYGEFSDTGTQLAPYNSAISRILDSADDIMEATTSLLLHGEAEPGPDQEERPQPPDPEKISPNMVREWLDTNLVRYFGERAKLPIDLFVWKIADELYVYQKSLKDLERYFQDQKIRSTYDSTLQASNVGFLPPYQRVLFVLLLGSGWELARAIARVNQELVPLGIRLREPNQTGA